MVTHVHTLLYAGLLCVHWRVGTQPDAGLQAAARAWRRRRRWRRRWRRPGPGLTGRIDVLHCFRLIDLCEDFPDGWVPCVFKADIPLVAELQSCQNVGGQQIDGPVELRSL